MSICTMNLGILALLQFLQNQREKEISLRRRLKAQWTRFPQRGTQRANPWDTAYVLWNISNLVTTIFYQPNTFILQLEKQERKLLASLKHLSVVLSTDAYTFPGEATLASLWPPTLCRVLIPCGFAEKKAALYISPALDFHLAPIQLLTLLSL